MTPKTMKSSGNPTNRAHIEGVFCGLALRVLCFQNNTRKCAAGPQNDLYTHFQSAKVPRVHWISRYPICLFLRLGLGILTVDPVAADTTCVLLMGLDPVELFTSARMLTSSVILPHR
jgi:hypothetical protein